MIKFLRIKTVILLTIVLQFVSAQNRVGDEGDRNSQFDQNRMDTSFPAQVDWVRSGSPAGVKIPPTNTTDYDLIIEPTDAAGLKNHIANLGANGGWIYLKNGTYTLDETIYLPQKIKLVGQNKDKVIFNCDTKITVFDLAKQLRSGSESGLYNITFTNDLPMPDPFAYSDDRPDDMGCYIYLHAGCYGYAIDNCNFLNAGNCPITSWNSKASTIRNCYFDGAHNKGAGGHGYIQIVGQLMLFYNNEVKNLRHFVLQREYCQDNTVYRNYFHQDINFHNADKGDNLVEQNALLIRQQMVGWNTIMGPWSYKHNIPGPGNYAYRNIGLNVNNQGLAEQEFSDQSVVYKIVDRQGNNPVRPTSLSPSGGSLYPWKNPITPTELSIFYPYHNSYVNNNTPITVVAKTDGDFAKMKLYVDDQLKATCTTYPYFASVNLAMGAHKIKWVGYDADNNILLTSNENTVNAVDKKSSIVWPINNAHIDLNANIRSRVDVVGNITGVRWYLNNQLLGEDLQAPFAMEFQNNYSEGIYKLKASYLTDQNTWLPDDEITIAIGKYITSNTETLSDAKGNVKLWPTIADAFVNYEVNTFENAEIINIYNLNGALVKTMRPKKSGQIDIRDLSTGMHLVEIIGQKRKYLNRIIKK